MPYTGSGTWYRSSTRAGMQKQASGRGLGRGKGLLVLVWQRASRSDHRARIRVLSFYRRCLHSRGTRRHLTLDTSPERGTRPVRQWRVNFAHNSILTTGELATTTVAPSIDADLDQYRWSRDPAVAFWLNRPVLVSGQMFHDNPILYRLGAGKRADVAASRYSSDSRTYRPRAILYLRTGPAPVHNR